MFIVFIFSVNKF